MLSPTPLVRRATHEDIPHLVRTLVRSFDRDPILRWFLREDERRVQALKMYFEITLREFTLPHGEVLTTEDRAGTALWVPPDRWKLGLSEQLSASSTIVRCVGLGKMVRTLRGLRQMEKHHPPRPHYYLALLGVDPEHQGRGYATALLRPVLERCDREGVGAYLESTTPENTARYQHFGFKVVSHLQLGHGAPPYPGMWREPTGARLHETKAPWRA